MPLGEFQASLLALLTLRAGLSEFLIVVRHG